jgi:hypothetical protein
MTAALQDQDNIKSRTTARSDQQQLHRSWRQISPAGIRRTIHRHEVTASGFGNETHAFVPANSAFHILPPVNLMAIVASRRVRLLQVRARVMLPRNTFAAVKTLDHRSIR